MPEFLAPEVAKLLDVDECTVINWEKHRTKPQLHAIPEIIGFLGYDPSEGCPKTLGERVLQYRKSCGVSQKELANRIGIDPTTLSRLERNWVRCSPSILKKVSAFLTSRFLNICSAGQ